MTWSCVRVAAGVGIATVMAGCGSTPDTPAVKAPGRAAPATASEASGPEACAVLTDEQVASATAHEVTSHKSRDPAIGSSECVWDLVYKESGDREIDHPQVTLTVNLSKYSSPESTFTDLSRRGEAVSGIGESASSINAEGEGIKLVALKGRTVIVIFANIHQTIGLDDKTNEALGQLAVQNL